MTRAPVSRTSGTADVPFDRVHAQRTARDMVLVTKAALCDRMWLFALPAAVPLPFLGNTPGAWMAFAMLALIAMLWPTRPTLFERALPLSAWALLGGKLAARALLILLPVGAWAAIGWWRSGGTFSGSAVRSMLMLGLLAVTLPYALDAITLARRWSPLRIVDATGAVSEVSRWPIMSVVPLSVGLIFAFVELSRAAFEMTTIVLAVVSTVSAVALWPKSVMSPLAIAVDSDVAKRAMRDRPSRAHHPDTEEGSTYASTWALLFTLMYPSARPRIMALVLAGLVLFQGVIRSDFTQWIFIVTLSPSMLVTGTAALATLPFSPRRRVWCIAGMGPMLLMAMYGIGFSLPAPFEYSLTADAPRVVERGRWYDNPTAVSITWWTWSRDGVVPTVASPWGESVEPFSIRVLGQTFYNPYSVRRASSQRFVAWQFDRLTTAVYGRPVTRAELREGRAPPRITRRWPTLLLCGSLLVTLALLATLAAWNARGMPGLSFHHLWSWLLSLPLFASFGLQIGTDVGPNPIGNLTLKGILAVLDALPTQPVLHASSVMLLALMPVVAMVMILDRSAREPRVEFVPSAPA